jgi:hypothetical protein
MDAEVHARAIRSALFLAVTLTEQAGWSEAVAVLGDLHREAARRLERLEAAA